MTNKPILTTQPEDWQEAWKVEAKKKGLDLSVWIGEQCNKGLPKEVRKTLSERSKRGQPKKSESG